jgi:hypothetical protein
VTRRHVGWPLALVVAGGVLLGSGRVLEQREPRATAPDLASAAVQAAGGATSAPVPPSPSPSPSPARPAPAPPAPPAVTPAPAALTLPGGGDPVPVLPIGTLRSGALALPEQPSELGWYAAGAVPGSPAGSAVIAGHVDSAVYGAGPLRELFDLGLGDRIVVTDEAGAAHVYHVTSRTTYRKRDLPRDVFRVDGPAQLALITCGGAFDRDTGNYEDNVVVVAAPVPAAAPAGDRAN